MLGVHRTSVIYSGSMINSLIIESYVILFFLLILFTLTEMRILDLYINKTLVVIKQNLPNLPKIEYGIMAKNNHAQIYNIYWFSDISLIKFLLLLTKQLCSSKSTAKKQ